MQAFRRLPDTVFAGIEETDDAIRRNCTSHLLYTEQIIINLYEVKNGTSIEYYHGTEDEMLDALTYDEVLRT